MSRRTDRWGCGVRLAGIACCALLLGSCYGRRIFRPSDHTGVGRGSAPIAVFDLTPELAGGEARLWTSGIGYTQEGFTLHVSVDLVAAADADLVLDDLWIEEFWAGDRSFGLLTGRWGSDERTAPAGSTLRCERFFSVPEGVSARQADEFTVHLLLRSSNGRHTEQSSRFYATFSY